MDWGLPDLPIRRAKLITSLLKKNSLPAPGVREIASKFLRFDGF
jgi:hypothetical protein